MDQRSRGLTAMTHQGTFTLGLIIIIISRSGIPMGHSLPQSSKAELSTVSSQLHNLSKSITDNMTDKGLFEAWGGSGYEKCADMVG